MFTMLLNIIRFLVLTVLLSTPFAALSWVLFGKIAAAMAVAIVFFSLLLFGVLSEKILIKLFDAHPWQYRVGFGEAAIVSKLWVVPEPAAQLFVTKRFLSARGSIFVTQGAIHLLNDSELLEALRFADLRCQRGDLVLRSLSACLLSVLLSMFPSPWFALLFEGQEASNAKSGIRRPAGLIRFLIILPWLQIFLKISGRAIHAIGPKSKKAYDLAQAENKITAEKTSWLSEHSLGVSNLFLFPKSQKSIFDLN